MRLLSGELQRSLRGIPQPGARIRSLAYTVRQRQEVLLLATGGGIAHAEATAERWLEVDVRVGDDVRENSFLDLWFHQDTGKLVQRRLPLTDDDQAVRRATWLATWEAYARAVRQLRDRAADERRRQERERRLLPQAPPPGQQPTGQQPTGQQPTGQQPTPSPATPPARAPLFSGARPLRMVESPARLRISLSEWRRRLRRASSAFGNPSWLRESSIRMLAYAETRTMVTSDGAVIQLPNARYTLELQAKAQAPDRMVLEVTRVFAGPVATELPGLAALKGEAKQMADTLDALRLAPLAEPYSGPAIFRAQAAAVLFHEVLGHTLEGHRFEKRSASMRPAWNLGGRIMPEFMSAFDDPRIRRLNGVPLLGFYHVDDEGVPSRRVNLVERGVLRSLLMSRRNTRVLSGSTGHGRGASGVAPVARQGNLVVVPHRRESFARLRQRLMEEVRRQGKTYGLMVSEALEGKLSESTQHYWLKATVVYQVFADGRPDRLVRGLSPMGSPAQILGAILAAGDDVATFNGTCNAESGRILVSATAPSLFVREIGTIRHAAGKHPMVTTPPRGGPP